MYRYTTPTVTLKISGIDFSEVSLFRIGFKKGKHIVLREVAADDDMVDAAEGTIIVKLTQEETASLEAGIFKVQVRCKMANGDVLATEEVAKTLRDVIDEVII